MLKNIVLIIFTIFFIGANVARADDSRPSHHAWYCPSFLSLKLNKAQRWYVKPFWTSYNQSFYNKLSSFLGAEWAGTKDGRIGQMMCLYEGVNHDDFPVVLHYETMTYMPAKDPAFKAVKNTFVNWKPSSSSSFSSKQEGESYVLECYSKDPDDCPFYPRITKKQGNIYKEVAGIKDEAVTNQD